MIHFSEEFGVSGLNVLKLDTSDEYTTFLCGIPADLLVKLYDKYRSRLLENNLRTFLQVKGKINQGIKRTIIENPEYFLVFNNGITSIANGVLLDE